MGALFESGGAVEPLLFDPDRFAKEIAALFTIQYVRMWWPLPDAIYIDPALKPITSDVSYFLKRPAASRWRDYSGQKILYLVRRSDECDIPGNLRGAHIYLLSYIYMI